MKNPIDALTRILPALVMACALAVITAEPAVAQTAKKLKCNGCIKSKHVKNNKIKSKDIKDGQVRTPDLADNAVNGGKIADGSVGNVDLAADAVDSSKVAADSLTAGDLATDSVTAAEIAPNAVGTSEVADDSIASGDLQNEPGVEFDFDNQTVISTDTSAIENLPITAPSAGFVVVTASGSFDSNVATTVTCSLGTSTAVSNTDQMTATLDGSSEVPFSRTQTFPVAAGSTIYRLVCSRTGGTGSVTARDMHIVAMFFPTQY